jgi:hypothetical protein
MGSRPSLATERLTNRPSNATVSLLFTSPAEGWNLKGWKKHHVSGLPAICVPKRNEWNWLFNYTLLSLLEMFGCIYLYFVSFLRLFGIHQKLRKSKSNPPTYPHKIPSPRQHISQNLFRIDQPCPLRLWPFTAINGIATPTTINN